MLYKKHRQDRSVVNTDDTVSIPSSSQYSQLTLVFKNKAVETERTVINKDVMGSVLFAICSS